MQTNATQHGRISLRSEIFLWLATGLAAAVTAIYAVQIIVYLLYPNYVDHAQPTVASTAWLGIHGGALYPDWVTGDVYGMAYGPLLFLVSGVPLLLSPTLMMSKIPGVVSSLIAFGIVAGIVHQKTRSKLTVVLMTGSLVALYGHFGVTVYWNRAEPFLILTSVLSLLAATRLRPMAAALAVGSLAGVAAGFKIHGFFYVLPAAAMVLGTVESARDRVVLSAAGIAAGAILTLLPFCASGASLETYLRYLTLAAHEGLSRDLLTENFGFAAAILAPTAVVLSLRKPTLALREWWLLAGLVLSVAVMIVIAAKPGSGVHHLFPFVPLGLYGVVVASAGLPADAPRNAAALFLILLAVYLPNLISRTLPATAVYYRNADTERQKGAELSELVKAYPDAQIGISDGSHYGDTFLRSLSVLSGHPVHVDFAAWMDMQYSGVPESIIIRFVDGCAVPHWILPHGSPFARESFYTDLPLLSDEFRKTFAKNYQLVHSGDTFEVWACRASPAR
jgi:hypothetical protein